MASSIWHTTADIPEDEYDQLIFFAGGSSFPYLGFYNATYGTIDDWVFKRDVNKWAYTKDLLKIENMFTSLLKALDKKGEE